jgi:hypothetical protein
MKKIHTFRVLFALLGVIVPLGLCRAQTTFFTDNFNGSTTNQISIAGGTPTASSTSYDLASTKTVGATIGPNLLHLTLSSGATSSGFLEAQALFAAKPVNLNVVGDYIEIDVVFTNSAGSLFSATATGSSLDLGLYNSGSTFGVITNYPVPFAQLANAGLNGNSLSPFATGYCEPWQGYFGQILSNSAPQILTRPVQNEGATTPANQDTLGDGAGTGLFNQPAGTGLFKGSAAPLYMDSSDPYTMTLRITLSGVQTLTISNALYQGVGTSTTPLFSQIAAGVTGANNIASGFDGLSIGTREVTAKANTLDPVMDISSISIFGQSTVPSTPPTISQQPVPTLVTTNGSCAMSVTVIGDNPVYQWYRNGTQALNDGGNISIVSTPTTSTLIISPAGTADQFVGANNGYYCVVGQEGANGLLTTNTTTNTLTLINSTNLIWAAQIGNWDVNTSVSWVDTNGNPSVFNYGDPVVFDDAAAPGIVTLSASYLSASSVTVSNTSGVGSYVFNGSGSIAGPGSLRLLGSGGVTLNVNNTFTGGTLISNANAYVTLQNYGSFGTGPVTLGQAGGEMEIVPAGSASSGIAGTVVIADNFTNLVDADSTFGLVLLGDLSGTANKTLTFAPGPVNMDTNQWRVRVYGGSTTNNANLNLADANLLFSSYQASGSQTYNGTITGPGGFIEKGTITYLNNGNSTFSGGAIPAQGAIGLGASSTSSGGVVTQGPIGTGPLFLQPDSSSTTAGDGFIFATINNLTLGNVIEYQSATNNLTLEIGGTNNITLTGPFSFNGHDGSALNATYPFRTLTVTNTGLTTFTGMISDGGLGYGFDLTGSGTTLFNATETYTGVTTNNGGTLLVNGRIGPGAVVVVTNSTANTNATLGGSGTITGPVTIQAGGTLTAGSQISTGPTIGNLTISSTLTFQGGSKALIKVNSANNPPSDSVAVTGALTYNGTLDATNLGASLTTANSYQIFPAGGSGNFTNIIGSPGPNLAWTFSPTTGILGVVATSSPFTVSPGITNIVLSGTTLTISGTNGQSGDTYYLLTATNLNAPVWLPVSTNTATSANFSFTITGAATPGKPQQYYKFSSVP